MVRLFERFIIIVIEVITNDSCIDFIRRQWHPPRGKYASDSDIVMIHDAARPFLSARMITDSLNAIQGHDGVLPVLSMTDTIYKSTDGRQISALIDRSEIYAGQAPETFRLGKYYEANKRLFPDKIRDIHGSTEPAVLAGLDVVMIPGDERNIKITTRTDFEHACERLRG